MTIRRTCFYQWRSRHGVAVTATACRPFLRCQSSAARSGAPMASAGGDAAENEGSVLFLSPSNWPEPSSTAAGTRTTSLLQRFSSPVSPFGSVHFGCGAKMPVPSADALGEAGAVHWHRARPNRGAEVEGLVRNIERDHGPIRAVIFDRFHAEEAFSFKIREACPGALLVLDMQDVHSLRLGRQCLVEEMASQRPEVGVSSSGNDCSVPFAKDARETMTKKLMKRVMEFDPSTGCLLSDDGGSERKRKAYDSFLRELASVHRSDLVLVCSSAEMKLLERWNVPRRKLVPAPFFCANVGAERAKSRTFEDKKDFASVGGFRHAPNVDSIELLRREIWPRIRDRLPGARIHVYGAYPTQRILSMNDERSGFVVHGKVDDLDGALLRSRVLLAPLRFGAGCKGKIVDAWRCGCPVVTTPVGGEGMAETTRGPPGAEENRFWNDPATGGWGGAIASDTDEFVDAAVEVYTRRECWNHCRDTGSGLLGKLFDGAVNLPAVENSICNAMARLRHSRRLDFVGALLWRDGQRSTEYFSKWIELKESLAGKT